MNLVSWQLKSANVKDERSVILLWGSYIIFQYVLIKMSCMAKNNEDIACSDQRNVNKEITKQQIYEYSKSFSASFRPRSSLIGAS